MNKEKNKIQEMRNGGYEEFQDYLNTYSDRELEMILNQANEEISGTNANIDMSRQDFERIWERVLDEPFFLCTGFLLYFACYETKRRYNTSTYYVVKLSCI